MHFFCNQFSCKGILQILGNIRIIILILFSGYLIKSNHIHLLGALIMSKAYSEAADWQVGSRPWILIQDTYYSSTHTAEACLIFQFWPKTLKILRDNFSKDKFPSEGLCSHSLISWFQNNLSYKRQSLYILYRPIPTFIDP